MCDFIKEKSNLRYLLTDCLNLKDLKLLDGFIIIANVDY